MYRLSEIPEEWKAEGYIQTRPFNYEQTFKSNITSEVMTEQEMLQANIIYKYEQIGMRRREVQ